MKKIFTKTVRFIVMLGLFVAIALPARAQYVKKVYENTNEFYTALTKDAMGNVYGIRTADAVHGSVVKYSPNSTTFITIFTGLDISEVSDPNGGDAPWGLAVNSSGDVYVSTDFKAGNPSTPGGATNCVVVGSVTTPIVQGGGIIKLSANGAGFSATSYTASIFLNGGLYYSGLAFDSSDRLYVLQEDDTNLDHSTVTRYSPPSATPTQLFNNLNDDISDNFPHNLAVASNGDIYVTNSGEIEQEIGTGGSGHKGDVRRYIAPGYTSITEVSQNTYPMSLALDPSGNLFVEETDGSAYLNYRLNEYNSSNALVATTPSPITSLDVGFIAPDGVAAISSSNFYVLDGNDPGALWQFTGPVSGQASSISISSIGATTAAVSWTNGGGASRAVFMLQGSTGQPTVSNSTNYTANAAFTAGTPAGTGWYCVYNGTGNSVNVTGLNPSLPYRVAVEEYNGTVALTNENYLQSTATNNPNNFTTATPTITPSGSLSALSTSSGTASSSTSITVSGSNLVANVTATVPAGFDISLNNSTWSGSGGSQSITETGGSVSGQTVYVRLDAGDAVNTYSGNLVLSSTSATTVNVSIPISTVSTPTTTISSLNAVSGTTTNASSVQYTATFAGSISGLSAGDFTLNTTGSVSSASVSTVSGSGTSWTVTVNTGSGDGTIQLAMNSASGVSPSVSNLPFTGATYTIDKTAPTVGIGAPSASFANSSASVSYTVTYADANFNSSTLATGNITLNKTSTANASSVVVTGSGTTRTVTLSGISGDGTLGFSIGSGTATDLAGNAAPASSASTTFIVDNTPPTISISSPSVTIANSSTFIDYTVTYNDANLILPSQPIGALQVFNNLVYTGNVSLGSLQVFNSVGNTVKIEFHGITGDGTLGFSIPAGTVSDQAGNAALASPASATFTVDNTPPTVVSLSRTDPNPTNGTQLDYQITFSEPVTGVDLTDFSAATSGVTAGAISVSPLSSTVYNITVANVSGNGTLQVNLNSSGTGITDAVGNAIATGFSGDTYTVQQTPPSVSSITATTPSNTNPTNATSVSYTVTFSEAVTGVDPSDFTATTSGVSTSGIGVTPVSGSLYIVTVSGISGNGTLRLDLNSSGTGIADAAGNAISGGFTSGNVYNIDQTAPTATTTFASNNANTSWAKVGDVITLSFTTSKTVQTPVVTIGGNSVTPGNTGGNNWTASYTETSGDAEGQAAFDLQLTDIAGNTAEYTSAGVSQFVTFDKTPPTVTISAPSSSSVNGDDLSSVSYTVTYADANFNSSNLPLSGITLNTTGTATGTLGISGSGTSYSVTISAIQGDGTLGISVGSGYSSDLAGNADAGSAPSGTFTVVSNNANLNAINATSGPLIPGFSANTTSYTLNVNYATPSITVRPVSGDPNATMTLNGAPITSGTTSAPIALTVGTTTTITVVVTAQDLVATKTYTFNVTRGTSNNANLNAIGASVGPLTPVFSANTTSYTINVSKNTASMTVRPVSGDAHATMTLNGAPITSGTTSAPITLAEGAQTTIIVAVTAQDLSTVKTYTFNVNRAPSTNANLNAINASVGPLSPAFSANTTSYTINVSNATATMTVRPVSADAHATMTLNSNPITSGTTSGPIALTSGAETTVTVVVTAQDPSITKTYTFNVNRAPGGIDSYNPGISVTKPTETPQINEDAILVHQGISPNGDGINDFLQVDNISQYPDNKLSIMNRNGQLVYEAKGYDNSSKVFDGHSNKNGQMQLPGTYFYQLDYVVGGIIKHKTGFLVLKY